jgi:hypothetical protein
MLNWAFAHLASLGYEERFFLSMVALDIPGPRPMWFGFTGGLELSCCVSDDKAL